MRYYLIAGEASGDLHGSNLMKSLLKEDPSAEFRFWGGDLMRSVYDGLVKHYSDTAVMGIVEVLSKLGKIRENLSHCKKDILDWKPDVIILIDYPGFNLRIAKFGKERGFRVFYYIPPKVWARGESRIEKLKRYTDKTYIIFPFEQEFFKGHNMDVKYFGNPLYDSIISDKALSESKEEFTSRLHIDNKPTIALLAGSRKHEISYLLPKLRGLEDDYPEYQFLLAGAPSIEPSYYQQYLSGSRIKLFFGETYSILKHSDAAAVSSGTASLECAIIDTPQVVCYGMNPVTVWLGKLIIKVKYASLVNLILDKELVKELLQWDCTPENISAEIGKILIGRDRKRILSGYKRVRKLLGGEGASEKVAKSMLKEIKSHKEDNLFSAIHETPMGRLKLICDDSNLIGVEYVGEDEQNLSEETNRSHPILSETARQLDEYFQEKRENFELPVKLNGTEFQKRVWHELSNIPYGEVKTYGEIASIVESRDASRAVGLACKMNPLLIVIPCHRVVGANNKLTGFAIGIDKKSYLLELEKAYLTTDNNLFQEEEKKMMRITAYKYQATGNDFVILDNREGQLELTESQIKHLCDRRFGVGADGLMLLNRSKKYSFSMVYYNADGREGTMCGNGGRSLVAFAAHKGIKDFTFEAVDGIHEAEIIKYSPSTCIVKLGISDVTSVKDYSPKSYMLNTGSPHLVIFVENVSDYDVREQGKLWRHHPHFPGGTNVNFVQGSWGRFNIPKFDEEQEQRISVRTYERGVEDETLSCGTGVTASAIAHHKLLTRNKFSYSKVDIKIPQTVKNIIETKGGELTVEFTYTGEDNYTDIKLTGPATYVFSCVIEC